jgi:thioredoxin 1
MAGNILAVTDDNFAQTIAQAEVPVLVDFWAPWCGPCRMIAPIVEQLADEYGDRLAVGKVNTDENGKTASSLGIRSIPTLLVFHQGKEVDRVIGYQSKEQLKKRLDALVSVKS